MLRQSMFLLAVYNMGIYLPLIAICIVARAMLPYDLGTKSDEVIPRMALILTEQDPARLVALRLDPRRALRGDHGDGQLVSAGDCLGPGPRRLSAVRQSRRRPTTKCGG